MVEYVEGYTSDADYCPKCGGNIATYYADGSNRCGECDYVFYIIEKEQS